MLQHITRLSAVCLITFIGFASQHAMAENCYAESPNLSDDGDAYYNVEKAEPFTFKTQQALSNLFQRIAGNWRGNVNTDECYGPDNAAYKKSKSGTLTTTNIASGDGGITLNNEVTFDHTIKTINSTVLAPANLFNAQVFTEKHVRVAQKIRRPFVRNGRFTGASRLIEIIYDFQLHDRNSLTIQQLVYTNGVFTYSETWSLSR